MMNASQLYQELKTRYGVQDHVICDLHNPCASPSSRKCAIAQPWPLINFDQVKTTFCHRQGIPSKASVDGYTYKCDTYCFVELKGWDLFFHYNPTAGVQKISAQAGTYRLDDKYKDSVEICSKTVGENTLFHGAKIAFVLVTDINVIPGLQFGGPVELYTNLAMLSERIPSKDELCQVAIASRLEAIPQEVATYYINCKNFDNFMRNILPD